MGCTSTLDFKNHKVFSFRGFKSYLAFMFEAVDISQAIKHQIVEIKTFMVVINISTQAHQFLTGMDSNEGSYLDSYMDFTLVA